MSFGTSVTFSRRKKGMQSQDLARATGIESSRIQLFEHDTEAPTLTEALAIAKVLDVSLEELGYPSGEGSSTKPNPPAPKPIGPPTFEEAVKWGQQHKAAEPAQPKAEPKKRAITEEGKKKFGKVVKEARLKHNISYAKIQATLGITTQDYVRIEHGKYDNLDDELIAKIIKLFNLTFD